MKQDGDGYIENQAEWGNIKYSFNNMQKAGCGVIAAYNALNALGENVNAETMVGLISWFETDGSALFGIAGTDPKALAESFAVWGYDVETTSSTNPEVLNKLGEESDTIIVTVYNNQDNVAEGQHFLSITKEENETYVIHNAYYWSDDGTYLCKNNGGKGYGTLQEAIDDTTANPKLVYAIGISNSDDGE